MSDTDTVAAMERRRRELRVTLQALHHDLDAAPSASHTVTHWGAGGKGVQICDYTDMAARPGAHIHSVDAIRTTSPRSSEMIREDD